MSAAMGSSTDLRSGGGPWPVAGAEGTARADKAVFWHEVDEYIRGL
jgi:hypothetical protein